MQDTETIASSDLSAAFASLVSHNQPNNITSVPLLDEEPAAASAYVPSKASVAGLSFSRSSYLNLLFVPL